VAWFGGSAILVLLRLVRQPGDPCEDPWLSGPGLLRVWRYRQEIIPHRKYT
jgi:hypothetical protein